jgi:hypothetical protein
VRYFNPAAVVEIVRLPKTVKTFHLRHALKESASIWTDSIHYLFTSFFKLPWWEIFLKQSLFSVLAAAGIVAHPSIGDSVSLLLQNFHASTPCSVPLDLRGKQSRAMLGYTLVKPSASRVASLSLPART